MAPTKRALHGAPSLLVPRSCDSRWRDAHPRCLAAEQRVRKLLGAERLQVLHLLAHADEVHRDRPLSCNGRENAAFGRAVELGDDQTCESERIVERFYL